MAEEPPTKKTKTGWEGHTLNCAEALMKADEGDFLNDIAKSGISVLQGIGLQHAAILKVLGVETVEELAKYKFFLMARGIKTLSETEVEGKRPEGSTMNVDNAMDKAFESKSFKEMVDAPIHSLQGLTKEADDLFESMGVRTVGDLADWKYCRWAEAIVECAKYEEQLTTTERKVERMEKKLS